MEERRRLSENEMIQRGCNDCADRVALIGCKYTRCPYHELDDYKKYSDYLRDQRPIIPTLSRRGCEYE